MKNMRFLIPNILLVVITMIITNINCKADIISSLNQLETEPRIFTELGESSRLILYADSIIVSVYPFEYDSVSENLRISNEFEILTKLIMCKPTMYRTDKKVYTRFEPYAVIRFYKGEDHIGLYLDYSSRKWELRDANEILISRHDIPDFEFLEMLYYLFPNGDLIKECYTDYIYSE